LNTTEKCNIEHIIILNTVNWEIIVSGYFGGFLSGDMCLVLMCEIIRFLNLICSNLALSETNTILISLKTHLLKKKKQRKKSDFCCTSKTSIKKEQGKTT
jgi:hypothetical protein